MKPTTTANNLISDTEEKSTQKNLLFPIVAIGASAGGLEAITELLKNLSSDTGMAFIFVQHLSPDHKSMLTPLLAKVTSMKVQEVKNSVLIKPNNLYVIPPDKEINVVKRHIKLTPRPESPKFNLPIDILFTSLAKAQKENTIGIILSGSANDGTVGLKSIKQEGGLTFAQDETAKFSSMPKSAIAAGVVDYILSPKEISFELNRICRHPFSKVREVKLREEDLIENSNGDLKTILNELHKAKGVDFGLYKMQTIKRRIIRRMLLHNLTDLGKYAKLIKEKNEELIILYQDLLINVTGFFRDPGSYDYFKTTLLPKIMEGKKPGETIRIWVPACSTGQEAFSIAMMLVEIQDIVAYPLQFQIFATDLSEKSIQKARVGLYTKNDLESVSPGRIQRFFIKSDGGYRISKAIRNICVFAPHNILRDPPFSRLDLISCRNLFIYLDIPAQKRTIETFHYALNDPGYLMLGSSESIHSSAHLFTEINSKLKIYARKSNSGAPKLSYSSQSRSNSDPEQDKLPENKAHHLTHPKSKPHHTNRGLESALDSFLLSDYMPASAVINHQLEIIQFRGKTDLYFSHAPGRATLNILKMVRPEIGFALRSAISKAIKTNNAVQKSGIEMKFNGAVYIISINVVPMQIDWDEPLLLILFHQHDQVIALPAAGANGKGGNNALLAAKEIRIVQLEEELVAAQADALSFSHEQEGYIEELQTANEEVVSSNEELQTVNEELETSKEEIESANEELITTNQELQTRNDLLNESYDYSRAIISTIHEPMIVLDYDLRVKTANQSFYKKFGVNEQETEGMLFYDLENNQWNIPRLRELLEEIVPKNSYFHNFEMTHTFPNIGEKILILNASRIVQKSHGEHLILLSFSDITETVKLQKKEKEILAREILESKSYNLQLEKAVKERTRQLKQTNISLAEKISELEKMNRELEAFNYVSSHDLQEPLRKIQAFVGRIFEKENQNLSERGKNYFSIIHKSAERMQHLIQDLLSFSSAGVASKKFEYIELTHILEEVKSDLKELIEEKNANIETKGICEVRIVPFLFKQVLTNLISNSLKFSKPDVPPHIIVACQSVKTNDLKNPNFSSHKEYCHISVQDNGIGFDQKYSNKIFDVFEKLHSKDEYAGTGIGLAIVKKIVENHNGYITTTSKTDIGTTFDIYIPSK